MPSRDIRSNIASDLGFYAAIVSDTTTAGQIVDTAHYDGGVMFSFAAPVWASGTLTPLIEESDDPAMAGATAVPDSSLIGTEAAAALTAGTSVGDSMPTIGVVCVKRYVRVSIVSTGGASATVVAVTNKTPEIKPVV